MSYVIYKICCDENDFVYVGSTKCFKQRKSDHKRVCNNEKSKNHNFKVYQTIREHGGWENWRIVVIEDLGNVTKLQACIREEQLRVELNGNMNTLRAYRTEEQRKEDMKEHKKLNKEHYAEYIKEYNEKNKETIKEYKKDYYINNKDKIKENNKDYYINNKDEINEKRELNKDEINKRAAEYYHLNKDTINKQKNEYYHLNKDAINAKRRAKAKEKRLNQSPVASCIVSATASTQPTAFSG